MTARNELRAEMKRRREELSALCVMEMSVRIGERLLAMPEYRAAKRIFCYHSLPLEVQTGGLIREMLRAGKEVYLPVTGGDRTLTAVRLYSPEKMHRGAFRVMEPDGDEKIDPSELDIILTPGLAFDRAGGRIGYGAGCFDRFLPQCRGLVVGLAFELQMVDSVPMEAHDFRMHRVVTEEKIYRCADGRAEQNEMEVNGQ